MRVFDIISLLPRSYKKKGILVMLAVPLRALLDLMGIAVLLPMLILVLDDDGIQSKGVLNQLYTWLGFSDTGAFIVFLVLSVLAIIIIKSVINLFSLNYQNKYLLSLYKFYSAKLFSKLYNKGLLYVKNSNTAEITYNINSVCYTFVVGYLASILRFAGDMIFSLLLLAALCFYDPKSSLLIIASFVPIVFIYLRMVHARLKKYGKEEMKARRNQQKVVQETFKGYAEMEINRAFPYMEERFDQGLTDISRYRIKSSLIQSIPPYLLEIAVAVVVSALVLFSVNTNDASMRIFLGVFTIAVIRMLPSVHALISTWNSIKSTQFTIETLEELVQETDDSFKKENSGKPLTFNEAIKVNNLSFSYSTGLVIDNLNFTIKKGERFGIRGRTGAGKSTLFNLLLGLFLPDEGSIEIDGVKLSEENIGQWHSIVGYVPQDVFIADLSIAENIALGHEMESIDVEAVWDVLKRTSLYDFVKGLPDGISTMLGESGCRISGGQRQRIGIARALYKKAEVLFFDEATSSLDTSTEMEINRSIQELSMESKQLTIIIISHRPSSLEFCDRILEI